MAPPADPSSASPLAAGLIAFVRGTAGSAGIERSCKIGPAGNDSSRFLLSFAADRRTIPETIRFATRIGMPPAGLADYAAAAGEAAFLHFGYEENGGAPRLKAYCERAVTAAADQPLYSAWKWDPGVDASLAVDYYRLADVDDGLIVRAFGGESALAEPCLALLDRARAEGGDPMLLDVARRGAARHSFDLRLYGARWTIDAADALLSVAERMFACDGIVAEVRALAGDAPLGHVSGGRDDHDAAFVTVYFGAREL